MINVKLIVLLTCIYMIFGNPYCEICPNHTLCRYTMPGSAVSCKLYDKAAHLTKNDISEIIKKLNERRNYVAMGHSRFLPAAANMRKILWCEELSSFAQRWVDQCDQSLWPDKEDQCRNRMNEAVGQNIATIVGASAFNVKSLVDTWFMKILDYSGNVSYYNQSRNSKTKYFTQMVWADTSLVGCARARFYVDHKNSMVERLVCNFAPQGNILKKPVYAIGYPATQCPDNTTQDDIYKGLCQYIKQDVNPSTIKNEIKLISSIPKVSSLLRILNLSNSSKQAIDPIRSNFKPHKSNANESADQRNQKIRHIDNNTYGNIYGDMRQHYIDPVSHRYNPRMTTVTPVTQRRYNHQERGHSRVYHGDHIHKIEQFTIPESPELNRRKFNFMADSTHTNYPHDLRKYSRNCECSRTGAVTQFRTHGYYPRAQCTRRPNKGYDEFSDQPLSQDCPENVGSHNLCQCYNKPKSCSTTFASVPSKCMCDVNCRCLHINNNQPATKYHNLRMQKSFSDDTSKSATVIDDYYDQYPPIGIRSEDKNRANHKRDKSFSFKSNWELQNFASFQTERKSTIYSNKNDYPKNFKNINDYQESYDDKMVNTFKTLDSYQRYRRNLAEEITFKPFWQMDELTEKKSPELKSLRYTTLSNRKNKVMYKNPHIITESITIHLSENGERSRKIATEKYLSFDELMRLRKLGETDVNIYGVRRAATTKAKAAATTKAKAAATTKAKAAATTKAAAKAVTAATSKTTTKATTKSSIITANTPFERKKHCTRKLTCTWTAITVTGIDGSIIGGVVVDVGSLTPDGYIDGCTRTSTCTRIYMNKNKFSTLSVTDEHKEESSGEEPGPHGDEDYCEKRSLDIHRRESDREYFNEYTTSDTMSQMSSPSSFNENYELSTEKMQHIHSHESSTSDDDDCTCDENLRVKRNYNYTKYQNAVRETLSYGDLYYRVLQKILSTWRNYHPSDKHKCACSYGIYRAASIDLIIILLLSIW